MKIEYTTGGWFIPNCLKQEEIEMLEACNKLISDFREKVNIELKKKMQSKAFKYVYLENGHRVRVPR